jgi:hypothetical protein
MTTLRDVTEDGISECCSASVTLGFCLFCGEHAEAVKQIELE